MQPLKNGEYFLCINILKAYSFIFDCDFYMIGESFCEKIELYIKSGANKLIEKDNKNIGIGV